MPQTAIRLYRNAAGKVPFEEWLENLELSDPAVYAKCLNAILMLHSLGYELRRPLSDVLDDGIRELRIRKGTVNYRILYFFCGENVVCLSHGIRKEKTVPKRDIDLAKARKIEVEANSRKHTAEWTI